MNHETTPTAPSADLAAAAAALVTLAATYPGLPTPYVTIHIYTSATISFQIDTPAGFEDWRTALMVPAEAVELKAYAGDTWLAADAVFQGIVVQLAGYGIELATAPTAVAA